MQVSFLTWLESWHLALILFVLMMTSIFIGLVSGRKYHKASFLDSAILAGLFALLGLILAFDFGFSFNHFDNKREIIIEEANDIGTTILRADLYRDPDRKVLREDLKKYVDARVKYFTMRKDEEKVKEAQELSGTIQQQLWKKVSELSRDSCYLVASMQMTTALNNMIDITNTGIYANYEHLPDEIIYLLIFLSCICTFYMGFISAGKEEFDWLMAGGACLVISLVVFVNFDLDRPRRGFITLDKESNSIVDLKHMFPEQETGVK